MFLGLALNVGCEMFVCECVCVCICEHNVCICVCACIYVRVCMCISIQHDIIMMTISFHTYFSFFT